MIKESRGINHLQKSYRISGIIFEQFLHWGTFLILSYFELET